MIIIASIFPFSFRRKSLNTCLQNTIDDRRRWCRLNNWRMVKRYFLIGSWGKVAVRLFTTPL
ncbi:fibronectin type II domain-containing protein [Terrimonas ginsenosidimutans]|uniref:fibronectin type II domain-containing protein n=1 Tax=Terrimonas ginsenosidimutans TaxID=2908004 RepID=UPI003D794720